MLASVLLAWTLAAQAATGTQVAPGILLVPGTFTPGSQPDGNSIVIDAPGGLIVVDTGRHPTHTQAILDVARQAGRPVAAIVNSHWHLDHVGGNPRLRAAYPGLRVYASDAIRQARAGFLADYHRQLEGLVKATADRQKREAFEVEMRLIEQGPALEPDEVIAAAGTKMIAERRLEVGLERYAVTAGDVWLFDPPTKVLVAGDLVTLPAPLLDTACPAQWQDALARLAQVPFTTLVPGHGAAMTRAGFDVYRTAFGRLLACGGGDDPKEVCVSGWLRDAASLLEGHDGSFTRSLVDYYVGVLRSAPAVLAPRCGKT